MRAGIYVDCDNVMRNGGWNLKYDELYRIVADQGADVLRANAYMAFDEERERQDHAYRQRKDYFRSQIRRCGFKVNLRTVRRFTGPDGVEVARANTDVDLAVDAMAQSTNLDYVVLVSGDGDFTRLVSALQDKGIRVDVISFFNTSGALRSTADNHSYGQVIPRLIQCPVDRHRGTFVSIDQDRFFGHLAVMEDYLIYGEHVFCHGTEINPKPETNEEFYKLYERQAIVEFTLVQASTPNGTKYQAREVVVLRHEQS